MGKNSGIIISNTPQRANHRPRQVHGSCALSKGNHTLTTSPFDLFSDPPSQSPIHQNIKDKIVASTESDTVHIFRTLHNTARVFKNKVSLEVVALERRPGGAKFEDLRDLVSGARGRQVYENGDPDYGIWSAGIAVGLIDDVPTCRELVGRLEREVEEIVGQLSGLVQEKAKL